ncbi:MAG: TolC family protein [Bacteroidales bacterium]|nr:TolC family protein [Candidatus Latescibacterota bacterium]
MSRKSIIVVLLLFTVAGMGCKNAGESLVLPEPAQLGSGYDTYHPVAKTGDIEEYAVPSSELKEISLSQCLSLALMHNPRLRAFSWNVRAREAELIQAGLTPDPELDVEVDGVGGPGEMSGFQSSEFSFRLSKIIELGGKKSKRIKLASLEQQSAGWDYEKVRLDLFAEVTKTFIEVVAAQERMAITEDLLDISEQLLRSVEKRVEAGKDADLEEKKARVILSRMKIQYDVCTRKLDEARRRLSSMWGDERSVFGTAIGSLDSMSPVPSYEIFQEMLTGHYGIRQGELKVERMQAALDLENALAIPDISFSGGIKKFNKSGEKLLLFGVSIPLPLRNRNQGARLRAGYELAGAAENLREVHSRVNVELFEKYSLFSSAYIEASQLKKNILGSAEAVFAASMKSYENGKSDYLNVLDSQRMLFEVRTQYIDALVRYHSAGAEIERLTGSPVDKEGLYDGRRK